MSECPVSGDHNIPNLYNPLSHEQSQNPFDIYKKIRDEQPVFFSPVYQMWIVSRYQDVVQVLKDTETFSSIGIITVNRDNLPPEVVSELDKGYPQIPGMTDNDPPYHDRIRSLVGKAFSQRIVTAMEPHIRSIANGMLDVFHADGQADILEQYAFTFPLIVIGDVLGVDREHLANLKQWSDDWVALLAAPLTLEQQLECARGFVAFQHFYYNLIEEKRRNPQQDLISHMIHARQEGWEPLTTLEMVNVCMSATWAGHQTVTSNICNMLHVILSDDELKRQVSTDRKALEKVLEETLRIQSPLQSMMRFTRKEASVGGVTIPAGAPVQVLFGSANHDESVFKCPMSFDSEREGLLNKHMAFGRGVHYCLGSQLARLEGVVAIEVLLERCRNLSLEPGFKLEYLPNFLYRAMKSLNVVWDA
ncbi:MAG: cytochrome P450 [Endozoicomonas sp.]